MSDPTDDSIALCTRGLVKRYGRHSVLRGVDLQVRSGEVHGLVGLNGSGKTTTIECVLGLQGFHSGRVSVLGFAPRRIARAAGGVGVVFDRPSLPGNLTVGQCLRHGELLRSPGTAGRSSEQDGFDGETVEAMLGLRRFSKFKVRNLSLGNKRRTAIAYALLGRPRLMVLDEPFNGLDAGGVDEVLGLIKKLRSEHAVSFLLSSHQLPYLEEVCSHLSVLHEGRVVRSGAVGELLSSKRPRLLLHTPQTEEARRLIEQWDGARCLSESGESSETSAGFISVELSGMDSAELNARLVQQGIKVAELKLQQPGLSDLLRQITGMAQT